MPNIRILGSIAGIISDIPLDEIKKPVHIVNGPLYTQYLLDEDESEDAHGPHIPGEVLELALLHKVHEPLEGDDAEDEGDDHAHQEFRREAAGIGALGGLFRILESHLGDLLDVLALGPLEHVEQCCTAHGWDAHEEAEFARVLAVHAHEHHGADGGAAAADARDTGDALHGAGHEGSPPVHLDTFVIRMLGARGAPLRSEKQNAGEEFGDAHGARVFEQAFERVLETEADECGRDTRQDDVARFLELFGIAADAAHDDVGNLLVENHEDGQQCAGMEHDVEEHARFVHA